MLVKHCPECREDYLPHVERCADCGATLVTRDDAAALEDEAPEQALPPGDYRVLLESDRAAELDPLIARLAQAGVPAKVEVGRAGQGFALKVRDEERARAGELLRDVLGDLAGREADLLRHFDDQRGGYAACPACETPLPTRTLECPECGLLLGEPACANCGAARAPEVELCATCGQASDSGA